MRPGSLDESGNRRVIIVAGRPRGRGVRRPSEWTRKLRRPTRATMSPLRALSPRFSAVFAVLGAGLWLASCSATSSSQAIVGDDAAVSAGGTGGSTNGGSSGGGTTTADSDGGGGTAGGTTGTGGSASAGSEAGASSDARADAPPAKPFCNGRTGDLSTDSYNCGTCGNICQPQGIANGLTEPSSLVADS